MTEIEALKQAKLAIEEKIKSLEAQSEIKLLSPEERLIGLIEGCVIYTEPENNESVFLMKDGTFMFEIDKSILWCSHSNVWHILEIEYKMKYDEIQSLIKRVVEERYKFRELTPQSSTTRRAIKVEERYKLFNQQAGC